MGVLDDCRRELDLLVRARYPILWLLSHEEARAERLLRDLSQELRKHIYFWSVTEGFDGSQSAQKPTDALMQVSRSSERAVFVLRDFHAWVDEPQVVRGLRDLVTSLKQSFKTLVILSPVLKIPDELAKDITVIDLPLPDEQELHAILDRIIASVRNTGRVKITSDKELLERIVQAALGLSASEAENVFAKAIVHERALDENDIPLVLSEKKQILRKSGLLEFYEPDEGIAEVGGLDELKKWVVRRSTAFTEKARDYGLPHPKGLLLLGVQGCGKSLTAKAVASLWKLPLLRLDMGRMFGSFIGQSEQNLRQATKLAEGLAPCVLWLDEIEKGFSGMQGGGAGDGGTSARVFGAFLTWLQEKTQPVFVIATSNNIEDLPPELLRKGRFDEIFFVDLPTDAERQNIFKIHLEKRKRVATHFDLPTLARTAEGFSGAEIEQAVVEAMFDAFAEDREFTTEDVVRAIDATVPLSQTSAERIGRLREWARNRARPASAPAAPAARVADGGVA